MKIVILGAKGMLGKDLGRVFFDFSPHLLDKDELDITDKESVQKLFSALKPNVVINAAAYTDVDGCETNKDLATKVNGVSPGYLAEASKDVGAIFVHYSTDYVFDGTKQEGYSEDDEPGGFTRQGAGPINFYGESKLAGESAVHKVGGDYYIIRTSWLYGTDGKNFVETILQLAQEINNISVVNDQHGKPTFSLDLARRTKEIIEGKKDFGIYHITNEPATTWYDFAKEIIKQGGEIIKKGSDPEWSVSVMSCSSTKFPRPAKRPQYSILKNTKLPLMRPWQEALREYLSLRKK